MKRDAASRRRSACTLIPAVLAAALAGLGSSGARAQSVVGMPEATPPAQAAAPIRFGNVAVRPAVSVAVGYDDNVTNAERQKRSSSTWNVSPSISAETQVGAHSYALNYVGGGKRYTDSRRDDVDSHALDLNGKHGFTARSDLAWQLAYGEGADARNSNDAARDTTSPNEWRTHGASATLGYGARDARGRVEFDVGREDKAYRNNREVTRRLDNTTDDLGVRFFWRVAPKTRLLVEVGQSQIEYDLAGLNKDSTERRYYLGGTWEATAKTTGIVKLGRQTKDFERDVAGRADFSGLSWEAQVEWRPRPYSVLNFVTSRATEDSTSISVGTPDYTVDQTYSATWRHVWSGAVSTRVTWALTDSTYKVADRDEDVTSVGVGVDYRFSRWLTIGFDYTHDRRASTLAGNDYDKNLFMLSTRFAL